MKKLIAIMCLVSACAATAAAVYTAQEQACIDSNSDADAAAACVHQVRAAWAAADASDAGGQ